MESAKRQRRQCVHPGFVGLYKKLTDEVTDSEGTSLALNAVIARVDEMECLNKRLSELLCGVQNEYEVTNTKQMAHHVRRLGSDLRDVASSNSVKKRNLEHIRTALMELADDI